MVGIDGDSVANTGQNEHARGQCTGEPTRGKTRALITGVEDQGKPQGLKAQANVSKRKLKVTMRQAPG
uniref:Uncharacterized protein n=1 Tax=Arion vulgaris TaxID=1028688 RepID=A0A0B7BU73_9EUPU